MYFASFPNITLQGETLQNITYRPFIEDYIKTRANIFDLYIVKDGEKIEDVAWKFYGDPEYHWVIMLFNDIIDPFYDWVLFDNEFLQFLDNKYPGTGNAKDAPDGTHHWLLGGVEYSSPIADAVSISNRQYEADLNEKKRKIKMIRKDYLTDIETELLNLIA